jgi:hypothetical protein
VKLLNSKKYSRLLQKVWLSVWHHLARPQSHKLPGVFLSRRPFTFRLRRRKGLACKSYASPKPLIACPGSCRLSKLAPLKAFQDIAPNQISTMPRRLAKSAGAPKARVGMGGVPFGAFLAYAEVVREQMNSRLLRALENFFSMNPRNPAQLFVPVNELSTVQLFSSLHANKLTAP